MHCPIDVKRSLKARLAFCVCVGPSSKRRILSAKRTIEGFAAVGMDVSVFDILSGVWMLGTRCLTLASPWPSFMGLRALVLHPDLYSFLGSFAGTTLFAVPDQFMANTEQDVAISALAIRKQGEVSRLVNELFKCPQGFFEQIAALSAASELPKKTAGPVHGYNCPTQGLVGGSILSDFCIDLVAFHDEPKTGLKQGMEKQGLLNSCEAGFPIDKSVLRHVEGSARGIGPKSFGPCLDCLDYSAQRFSDAGKKGIAGPGKVSAAADAPIDCPPAGVGCFISGMFLFLDTGRRGKRSCKVP